MFYFDEINGKKILKSNLIKKAQSFFTTKDICICDKGGNEDYIIHENIEIIANYLNISTKNLISPEQTHSANIDIVKLSQTNYPDTDSLIISNKEQAIFLNFADCTPIIFYDEKQNIGAIAHAGWRGTAQKIAPKTVEKMISDFGSKPEDIITIIGPAICKKCYEVGKEVYNQLQATLTDSMFTENENICVDLKEINKKQLTEIGIEKIDICPYCTYCNNKYFYSYRKEKGTNLRHSAVLKLS